MLRFPNCKINLGLCILDKREDGYHNIETIFYPIPIHDCIEIIENNTSSTDIIFTSSGLAITGNAEDNICVKAYHLLKKDFAQIPSIYMHLHKQIPMGAGLGGGSADGAFMLQLLNDQFLLGISHTQLINYALQLGSDCPFFIKNKPCLATGRGEVMDDVEINLSGYQLMVINPLIYINTAWAFTQLQNAPKQPNTTLLKNIITQPIETWKNNLTNHFETPIFKQYPNIQKIKENLYQSGATYAAMSGSGSTVYGLFKKEVPKNIYFPTNYYTKIISL